MNDAAGVIEAVGDDVTSLKVGDRVYTAASVTGAYAELTLAEASQELSRLLFWRELRALADR